jgi:hypothetical protein
MTNSFNVITIWVKNESRIVVRMILCSQARRSIIIAICCKRAIIELNLQLIEKQHGSHNEYVDFVELLW